MRIDFGAIFSRIGWRAMQFFLLPTFSVKGEVIHPPNSLVTV
jgi:hypothetical protein